MAIPSNEEALEILKRLESQFTILNIEGLCSSLYVEYWDELYYERIECPRCQNWGTIIAEDDWGYIGELECPDCEGEGEIDQEVYKKEEASTFTSNIII